MNNSDLLRRIFIPVLFFLFILANCKSKQESLIEEIQGLVEEEKYEKATELLKNYLLHPKSDDEILSEEKPESVRIVELSHDRKRLVYVEDNKLTVKDLSEGKTETKKLDEIPASMAVSLNAKFALSEYPMATGCRLFAISLTDNSLLYESGAQISCRNRGGISDDGSKIFYFVDNQLYEERTVEPRTPKLVLSKEKIAPPFPNLKSRFFLYPIGKDFLLFSGNAGSYTLYYFQPDKRSVDKLDQEVISPLLYYGPSDSAFYLGGTIGRLHLRRLQYGKGKPSVTKLFTVSRKESNPWKLNAKNEYLSNYSGKVHLWGPLRKSQVLPLLCERTWIVHPEKILCETEVGGLYLTGLEFTDDDWTLLKLYEEVRNK
ncbi:hypothetical protein LEP1GSC050_3239 [Leptospira broomii serovar Hurstbridge str. 5399]|uniref:Uncharacterized protein n=1 Tax=Leptospira broomii serovar Hurstbridge str. 5399 TaxID=1049789 RepID=T0FA07_9LEPT|nr:hypothetical protein [Leptospira broomii]EQA44392.1 hypothetical protein LEP1GSC050_3239 [Leptospira broomii serovar Hurstbridge str. 5399]